jgi:hypothetical protein
MAGVWPSLDCSDLETRVRTYLNEVTAGFYTQADIYRWLSIGAKDIAQKTLCVRRILTAATAASTRNVAVNAYKVLHVEYVPVLPATGRRTMLTQIDPLRVGHYPGVTAGTTGAPLFWYESGANIGIEPIPDGIYQLRLYVADLPKMAHLSFTTFSEGAGATQWTDSATGWTLGTTAVHGATGPETLTYKTALASANTNITVVFNVSGVTQNTGAYVKATIGTAGPQTEVNGVYMATIAATTPWTLVLTGVGASIVDNLYVYKEADFASATDQTELPTRWQHLLALYATYNGLMKDKKYGPAQMLESIYNNELMYLKQNTVEVIPDGRNDLTYL